MTASYIQLPADSTGKKVQAWSNTVGADTVYTQGNTPTDSSGAEIAVATDGKLDELNGNLGTIANNTPATGQATMTNSVPVTIATDQSAVPVSVSGGATAEKQDTGNTSIASIDSKTPSLGQALAAASVPVILPAATISTLTPPAAITGFSTSARQDTAQTTLDTIAGAVSAGVTQQNLKQVNGVTTQTGLGTAGTGTQRVAVASDSSIILAAGSATIGALTANQTVNVAQINGVTPLMGAGNTGTGSQRVTIATDQVALPSWPTPSGATGQAPSNSSSSAYETNRVAKASAGTLYGFNVHNSSTSSQWIQLHNTTSLPADTAVPVRIWKVLAGATLDVDFGVYGRRMSTGITLCNSSTGPTKTVGSADCYFDVQYV